MWHISVQFIYTVIKFIYNSFDDIIQHWAGEFIVEYINMLMYSLQLVDSGRYRYFPWHIRDVWIYVIVEITKIPLPLAENFYILECVWHPMPAEVYTIFDTIFLFSYPRSHFKLGYFKPKLSRYSLSISINFFLSMKTQKKIRTENCNLPAKMCGLVVVAHRSYFYSNNWKRYDCDVSNPNKSQ